MDWTECPEVEVKPGKVSGRPILTHSRVTADQVIDSAETGESVERIAYSFELPVEQVKRVLSFAASRSLLKPTP